MFAVLPSRTIPRPLRIEVAGAWCHVMNRGHRSGALFLERHADWGRDGVKYVAVRHGGRATIVGGGEASGHEVPGGGQAVKRFRQALAEDPE